VTWRTPGADGGRDIEATAAMIDISGQTIQQKWYIECKRFRASLNWPTVYEKISYALNHRADFLLIVTTSNFSPNCQTEVNRFNSLNPFPKIRIWPAHQILRLLDTYPIIAAKYGLSRDSNAAKQSFEPLLFEITKLAQSAMAATIFEQPNQLYVEVLCTLSELVSLRLFDLGKFGKFVVHPFNKDQDSFDWCAMKGADARRFDQAGLRAVLSIARACTRSNNAECNLVDKSRAEISLENSSLLKTSTALFSIVKTFGLIEISMRPNTLIAEARDEN
jgi:hypothetical protein